MSANTRRREWIKSAIIVFLTIMLILTFFSNTIMNYSLPEVATQNATSASITAKVRGTGTIEASDPYNVEIKESRVIASVAVKQGDTVQKGDTLFTLEDAESTELTDAIKQLDDLKKEYEQAILSADSSTSLVDRVENGETTSSDSKLARIDGYNTTIDRLEKAIESYNRRIAEIDNELGKMGEASVDTSGEQRAVNDAIANLASAEAGVTAAEQKLTAAQATLESVNSAVKMAQDNEAACQTALQDAKNRYEALLARKKELEDKKNDSATAAAESTSSADSTSGAAVSSASALSPDEEAELERLTGSGEGSVTAASKGKIL